MADFHFYVLDADGQIFDIVDAELPDDRAAHAFARTLLRRGPAVEIMRGECVVSLVRRGDAADLNLEARRPMVAALPRWLDLFRGAAA